MHKTDRNIKQHVEMEYDDIDNVCIFIYINKYTPWNMTIITDIKMRILSLCHCGGGCNSRQDEGYMGFKSCRRITRTTNCPTIRDDKTEKREGRLGWSHSHDRSQHGCVNKGSRVIVTLFTIRYRVGAPAAVSRRQHTSGPRVPRCRCRHTKLSVNLRLTREQRWWHGGE